MKLAIAFASLVTLTAVAHAETQVDSAPATPTTARESRGYFGAGLFLGAQRAVQLGGALELGVRAGESPVYAHVMLAVGDSGLSAPGGSFEQLRAGVETRACFAKDRLCVFGGADLGFQHEEAVWREWIIDGELMAQSGDDLMLVPRVGYEIGRTVKLRSTLEMPLHATIDGDRATGPGVAATGGLAFAF